MNRVTIVRRFFLETNDYTFNRLAIIFISQHKAPQSRGFIIFPACIFKPALNQGASYVLSV